MIGRIKWFDNKMGYGFIEYTDQEDIFVHYSSILQDGYKKLEEGEVLDDEDNVDCNSELQRLQTG